MKHLLIIIMLSPLLLAAQDSTGTLKVRKNESLQAYTSIAGITKGKIHINKIATKPTLELNSNKPGQIVSFEIGFRVENRFMAKRVTGNTIPNQFIQLMKKHKPSKFYIEKIVAQINGREIKLPLFSLKLIY